ncbi:hypothetical protein TNCT_369921 [Trichonephila clavata]|uniref:Uncharacterized protein n=1 Tax=Trichonephila clavata TaxID=2740835 RepID=A0A8X6GRX3_TRICU|nr:hypothetical protein TNCT_369921 [Trichonephila clavata]
MFHKCGIRTPSQTRIILRDSTTPPLHHSKNTMQQFSPPSLQPNDPNPHPNKQPRAFPSLGTIPSPLQIDCAKKRVDEDKKRTLTRKE